MAKGGRQFREPPPVQSAESRDSLRYDARLLRRLAGCLRPYRASVLFAVAALTGHSVLSALGPYLTKIAVDHCLVPSPAASVLDNWLSPDRTRALFEITAAYLLLLGLLYLLKSIQIRLIYQAGQWAMYDLRQMVFRHFQQRNIAFFDRRSAGRLTSRVTADVNSLNELFTAGVAALAGDLLTLVFIVVVMLMMSPMLTLALAVTGPLALLLIWRFRHWARRLQRSVRSAVAEIQGFLQERLSGVTVIQLCSAEDRNLAQFSELNTKRRDVGIAAVRIQSLFLPTLECLAVFAAGVVLLFGGWLVEQDLLTLGVVVAFLQYGSRVYGPLQGLSGKFSTVQAALAGAERIFRLLDEPLEEPLEEPSDRDSPAADNLDPSPKSTPRVEFVNVSFAYQGEDWVLEDVSFSVEPNEMVAIVGHTGAGKTSLINLLLRFYEPQRGQILVGGRDVREWPREQLRRQFGVVLQEPYLFSGSIGSNIRLGNPNISEQQAIDAAEQVNLWSLAESLPGSFDESIGERGSSLSSGQRQLLSFARALAHNPQFLILDEATSSVDTATEHEIQTALSRLVEGHTSIVVAHRLSTIRRADRILVMHRGRLRESGSHAELLAQGGIYSKLYELQFREQESTRLPSSGAAG